LGFLIREDRHPRQALLEAHHDPEDPEDDPERYQPEHLPRGSAWV